jgi:hypothetical protein
LLEDDKGRPTTRAAPTIHPRGRRQGRPTTRAIRRPIAEWMKSSAEARRRRGHVAPGVARQNQASRISIRWSSVARDNQKALRESGKVKIPGEDATPAEIKTFREAVGAPETAEGYSEGLKMPEGAPEGAELDTVLIGELAPIALEHNIPKPAFEALAAKFMEKQVQDAAGDVAAANQARDDHFKEWGKGGAGALEAKKEDFRRGARLLGLDVAKIQKMQKGLGVAETMDLLANAGAMAGEDTLGGGGDDAAKRFGYSDLESAEKALRAMEGDEAMVKKIRAKDPVVYQRYKGLVSAVAHFREKASSGA